MRAVCRPWRILTVASRALTWAVAFYSRSLRWCLRLWICTLRETPDQAGRKSRPHLLQLNLRCVEFRCMLRADEERNMRNDLRARIVPSGSYGLLRYRSRPSVKWMDFLTDKILVIKTIFKYMKHRCHTSLLAKAPTRVSLGYKSRHKPT